MIKTFWGTPHSTIDLKLVLSSNKSVEDSYALFTDSLKATGVDLDEFAGSMCEDDFYYMENASLTEKYMELSPEDIYAYIFSFWKVFTGHVQKETGIVLSLLYPDSSLLQKNRVTYFVVENATIVNPDIDSSMVGEIKADTFLFGE